MKKKLLKFLKVFSLTLLIACLFIVIAIFSYIKLNNPLDKLVYNENEPDPYYTIDLDGDPSTDTPLEKAMKNSKRINVLVVGLEHVRTDTIMLASFDRETKEGNIISIPRDTFIDREGYTTMGAKRINAIYQDEDIDGLIDVVEKMFQIHIHKYVAVDYKAVVAGVDALGGVEVDIPIRMKYTDPYDDPPLIINFQPGKKLLNGEDALRYLRFRKNDDGTGYPRGDIDRIATQQDFVKQAIKKVLSFKLANLIRDVYPYVKTNFSLKELMALALDSVGFNTNKLSTEVLPGEGKTVKGASLYFPDYEKAIEYTYRLYGLVE